MRTTAGRMEPFAPLRRAFNRLRDNPVVLKELRGRMRGGRAFLLLTIYLGLVGAMVGIVYLGSVATNNAAVISSPITRRNIGQIIFWAVAGMELVMVSFIGPALTAGAISGERERQTYDLLRTTLLPRRDLVFGKLASALFFLLLLLATGFPLLALAYLLGGIAIEEVAISMLILVVSTIFFTALGLFFSTFIHRVLVSTVLTYITTVLLIFGIPIFIIITLSFFGNFFFGMSGVLTNNQTMIETILIGLGWVLISLNPLASAIGFEVILMNDQSLWYTKINLSNGTALTMTSPWISFTVIYLLLSLLLITWSIRILRKPER